MDGGGHIVTASTHRTLPDHVQVEVDTVGVRIRGDEVQGSGIIGDRCGTGGTERSDHIMIDGARDIQGLNIAISLTRTGQGDLVEGVVGSGDVDVSADYRTCGGLVTRTALVGETPQLLSRETVVAIECRVALGGMSASVHHVRVGALHQDGGADEVGGTVVICPIHLVVARSQYGILMSCGECIPTDHGPGCPVFRGLGGKDALRIESECNRTSAVCGGHVHRIGDVRP